MSNGLKATTFLLIEDARPSDAIILALKFKAPIYVAEKILDQAQDIEKARQDEEWDKILKNLKPEDLSQA